MDNFDVGITACELGQSRDLLILAYERMTEELPVKNDESFSAFAEVYCRRATMWNAAISAVIVDLNRIQSEMEALAE